MDVIIPSHNLKTFSSSVTTLSKIGNHLYIEFDPLTGLTLRTINDAKSAYAQFHFEVGFFERCTSPPGSSLMRPRNRQPKRNGGISSVRDSPGRRSSRFRNRRKRSRSTPRNTPSNSSNTRTPSNSSEGGSTQFGDDHNENEEDEENMEEKYFCRVPFRMVTPILKQRKGAKYLRVKSLENSFHPGDNNSQSQTSAHGTQEEDEQNGPLMQLSFEYQILSSGIMQVIHKVCVTDAHSVVAMSSKEGCSEVVALPKLLVKMFEPIKLTNLVALTINDVAKIVTATTFHHTDANGVSMDNKIMRESNATVLKAETSIDCDEFDEYNFMDGRDEATLGATDIPEHVDEEIKLVFSIKETKAMLQFCSQSNIDEELRAIISFHWGGRPVTIETEGDNFHAELILATVDYKLLNTSNNNSRQQSQR